MRRQLPPQTPPTTQFNIEKVCCAHADARERQQQKTTTLNQRGSEGEAYGRTIAPLTVKTASALELAYGECGGRDDELKTQVVQNTFHQQSPHKAVGVCVKRMHKFETTQSARTTGLDVFLKMPKLPRMHVEFKSYAGKDARAHAKPAEFTLHPTRHDAPFLPIMSSPVRR